MKNCEGCDFYEACQTAMVVNEQSRDGVLALYAGMAGLWGEIELLDGQGLDDFMASHQSEESITRSAYLKSDEGRKKVVELLAVSPELQATYYMTLDHIADFETELNRRVILVQETCEGANTDRTISAGTCTSDSDLRLQFPRTS